MRWQLCAWATGAVSVIFLLVFVHYGFTSIGDCEYAVSNPEMIECEELQLKTATRELNNLYQQLNKVLNAKERKALSDAQKAWLGYRKAHCYSIALPFEPGSIVPVLTASCFADLTKERVKQLRSGFRNFMKE
jgi:uncharacterized protein YecT (DUF1311 family)